MMPDRVSDSASPGASSATAVRRRRRAATRFRVSLAVAAVALALWAARIVEQHVSVRAALAEGEEAFRGGDFVRAADRFRAALEIDPASTAVRLRLVAAYRMQYVPGGESAANLDAAKQALGEIARVLDRDPSNRAALLAAGEISDARSEYDRSREWYGRLAAIDSASAAAFAGMSAASLTEVSGAVLDAEARAGALPAAFAPRGSAPQADGHPIANEDLRRSLAERWSGTIADGIDAASKAVTLDRGNERAMRTLEAWHQLAADLAASPEEYSRHRTAADEWRRKALAARRLEAERSAQ